MQQRRPALFPYPLLSADHHYYCHYNFPSFISLHILTFCEPLLFSVFLSHHFRPFISLQTLCLLCINIIIITPYHHTLLSHPIITTYNHTPSPHLLSHPIITPYNHNLSSHPIISPYLTLDTLSSDPTPPCTSLYLSLSSHPIITPYLTFVTLSSDPTTPFASLYLSLSSHPIITPYLTPYPYTLSHTSHSIIRPHNTICISLSLSVTTPYHTTLRSHIKLYKYTQ